MSEQDRQKNKESTNTSLNLGTNYLKPHGKNLVGNRKDFK